ncbi:MAG: stearoyl-CoA desaturase (delta-9 desaturase) [Limisphaerales bacterium]|nr:MAG: stearoyl-CoA desaturase (delta-9 desaturase) [Limisphaerales bacterium]KAG0509429.1 MAG: stearoyl-CoA desaturase (delta-9 desaturase) [Limisphaerales bacterium]TXT52266.1 MAG: stearoyl-CoA desaturase (delta-9 desaturase) [Limisphaerales bacterium]
MKPLTSGFKAVVQWFDSDYGSDDLATARAKPDQVDFGRCTAFILLHAGCLGVLWVGWSWTAVAVAVALYFARMFAITGFYHRYFSHRSFSTSRLMQFLFAVVGSSSAQRGPLWWAAHHRAHHQHSDRPEDTHSPRRHGFWWAHIGWITSPRNFPTDYSRVKDLAKYPELVFLNRFDALVPLLLGAALYGAGAWLAHAHPGLGTSGAQLLVWGFVSTVVLFHCTCFINSLAHVFGRQRFATGDTSRNSLLLALLTLGEGWHNNHHHYMHSTRQGFYWWEIDLTYYALKALSWTGLIWNLRPVPVEVLVEGRQGTVPSSKFKVQS